MCDASAAGCDPRLTISRSVAYDGLDADAATRDDTKEYPCLIRAMDGRKTKFSTRVRPSLPSRHRTHAFTSLRQVEPSDLEKFQSEYGTLLKASMSTLRKRDKKREKLRAEELAKKKKRLAEEIAVSGPKRGAGRRKRKRLATAAVRLAEFKRKAAERDAAKTTTS